MRSRSLKASDHPAWWEGWEAHRAGQPLPVGHTPLYREGWLARARRFPRT